MAGTKVFAPGLHQDPGLQPERTTLAWGRTMMALATVSAIFLRWLPHHGFPILLLVAVSTTAAGSIYLTQRRRYRASTQSIAHERADADAPAILWAAFAAMSLGILGLFIILRG